MIKVWGIKNCNSVKKALDFLNLRGIEYEFINYKKFPPSQDILRGWIKEVGMEVIFNTKSATYKKMGIQDQRLSEDEKIALMIENPTLIKRPVLDDKNRLEFGFSEDRYEKIF